MIRSARLAAALGLGVSALCFAQNVSCEKYALPNGMTVILHEDHSLPVASVNIWYYVGSKDELARRSGFAHLFEHLMFMGTQRVPNGDFDNIMEAGGGWNNASTSEDRTNYFEFGPASLLPTLLWLEADRLQDLGEAMTQDKLDKQRDIVRNERRQSYENRPYGQSELRIFEMMFPPGHPYHIPVIGTHEDLEAATVEDVKKFFSTYYLPCNGSLVVTGDFDPAKIKPLIESLFGTLPRGSDPVHRTAAPVRLSGIERTTMSDAVQFAKTTLVFHSPPAYRDGDAEMELTAAVLADGISSRLYQKLIYDNELAVDVDAAQESMLLGSLFVIEATARPGVSPDTIEEAIDQVVSEYVKSGPTEEELERHKAAIEYAGVSRLQSIMTKADLMNAYQFYYGEPNSFKRDLDRYRNATVSTLKNWAAKTLTLDSRLILRVLPETPPVAPDPRDQKPAGLAAKDFAPPLPEEFELSNGIKVYHWQRSDLPLVSMTLQFGAGSSVDPPGQAGLASITADMLDEGAGQLDAVAYEKALDLLGATVDEDVDQETASMSLSVLSRNFDKALPLFADAVRSPRFDATEWERVQSLRVEELKQEQDEPRVVAARVGMRAFFGDDHPYGNAVEGTPESVAALTREQAVKFHQRLCRPANAVILLAGDLTKEQAKQQLEKALGSWKGADGATALSSPAFPEKKRPSLRVVLVDRPGAVQTVIRFYMPAPAYGTPNRIKMELLNVILGGSFTSRLNQNLREAHGYTYGARSNYALNPSVGYFLVASDVRADVTGASLREFLAEFERIRKGDISEDEAVKARAAFRAGMIQDFAELGDMLDVEAELVRNARPFTQPSEDLEAAETVSAADLNALAKEAVPLERGVLVLVGDKARIMEQLPGLPLASPIELTVTGEAKSTAAAPVSTGQQGS